MLVCSQKSKKPNKIETETQRMDIQIPGREGEGGWDEQEIGIYIYNLLYIKNN